MTTTPRFALRIGRSRIDGRGVFACSAIPARRKIGELTGEIVSQRTARQRARQSTRVAIVEFGDGEALDATSDELLRFINHSCGPNCYIRLFRHRVEFYSRRRILEGEELTASYGATHHDGRLACRCGSPDCQGYL